MSEDAPPYSCAAKPPFPRSTSTFKVASMLQINGSHYRTRSDIRLSNGAIPITYWTLEPNVGDLLSPWLIQKLTGLPTTLIPTLRGSARKRRILDFSKNTFAYLSIGSIISRTTDKSIVWGSGAFGTELAADLHNAARYTAVRGPLTRNLLRTNKRICPAIYGDPALLIPMVYNPPITKTHKIGIVVRWSEYEWQVASVDPEIKLINLGVKDVEATIEAILSCECILSSSLHGIILADAYGIPSAWLASNSPKGLEFKFYDYFLSIGKIQRPQYFDFQRKQIKSLDILSTIDFSHDHINFEARALLDACPFLERSE